ncbi:Coenzyme PQQ synthesis protein E [Chondromyces apiculatus DSM 436]|uniref:PqqA peptide cyclase n=2 Tax=Chondromyces apiculatus TaxID=51 RepID=A0A017T8W2_9BACT|nr:pyrroloquinoline quinone biosynthesis protein PqqE [Chondromyces apiculatus]EYF05698.1 Coenzyme PQQ synthesis protein E [Chondromyces apiculatus DSM 436]
MTVSRGEVLRLAPKVRLARDRVTGRAMLLYPERGLDLSAVAAAIVERLDGLRSVEGIAEEVAAAFGGAPRAQVEQDVVAFLEALEARALVVRVTGGGGAGEAGAGHRAASAGVPPGRLGREAERADTLAPANRAERAGTDVMVERPYTLIAELTYRCPLRCPYCSNPVALDERAESAGELSTEEWRRVFADAVGLGVMQLHLTGGEPLARRDLEDLVRAAQALGLYTNLITSGIPLTRERLAALREAGIDNVQLSFQDESAARGDLIGGYAAHARKLTVAGWVKAEGLPLTVNVVLHRRNIDHVAGLVALAERLGADRLELANTQYLGWALANRGALMPTREQLDAAFATAAAARERLRGAMEIVYVTPDYFADRPRACMEGWARRYVHVTPAGKVLPCHAAQTLPGLAFEGVRERPLPEIWRGSAGLDAFRGEGWMKEPCRSCDRRGVDFGGCRCQAYHLAGDAAAADPACALSPDHGLIEAARLGGRRGGDAAMESDRSSATECAEVSPPYRYRTMPARRSA